MPHLKIIGADKPKKKYWYKLTFEEWLNLLEKIIKSSKTL